MYTRTVLSGLAGVLSESEIGELLDRVQETRSIDQLSDLATWSSFDQFRRLLEEVDRLLGPGAVRQLARVDIQTAPELAATIQSLGSPGAVLAAGSYHNPLLPIRSYQVRQTGSSEWTLREWFVEGFDPYPAFCELVAGQYQQIPVYFGLAPAEVAELECQCRGDPACVFRIHWQEEPDRTGSVEGLQFRVNVVEDRLGYLQAVVTDLAANERYEEVLEGIVSSSVRALGASGGLMVIAPSGAHPRRVYAHGLTARRAEALADRLSAGEIPGGAPAMEVASVRNSYGILAIDERGAIFEGGSESTLATYAQLAASALDIASSVAEARNQAARSSALLELSTSLAEIASTEETARKLVRAVPSLIDCDRAVVFLDDPRPGGPRRPGFRALAAHGYPDEMAAALGGRRFDEVSAAAVANHGLLAGFAMAADDAAAVAAPLTVAGSTIGWIAISVVHAAERLTLTSELGVRLGGVAAQGAIAISNARLLEQVSFQAMHDPLTGLPNRALILDRTEHMLARAGRARQLVAALYVDLDEFKEVNDTFGHAVGDQLLQAVATRLTTTMRESDTVGRLGGDEFVVLVEGATMDAGPELVAGRIIEVLREPFVLESVDDDLRVTASVGVAVGGRASAADLLRDADIALYAAKGSGRDQYALFNTSMQVAVQDHYSMELDLRQALALGQFRLVYQPIFDLRTGGTVGVEALLRWDHPERGEVQPDAFVPVLESSGMIVEVGRRVVGDACADAAMWRSHGYAVGVSVNVSTRQLESDQFVADVTEALARTGLDAGALTVEITETSMMRNVATVVPRLTRLKELGVRIAIDDFGTGYSSLASLRQLPVDTIKIDRTFVAAMADSPGSGLLVRSLAHLGQVLGLQTLAEGVELVEQWSQLREDGFDGGQGFVYARPLRADDVETFLEMHSAVSGRGGDDPLVC